MPVIRGAIWDVDGTLLDSMRIWRNFGERYLGTFGIQARPEMENVIHKLSMIEAAGYLRKEYLPLKSVQEIIDDLNRMIEGDYFYTVKTKKGVKELLMEFYHHGVKMCIATATDRYQVEAALKREGIFPFFENIFTCSEVGIGKNNPEIYLQAWKSLQTKKEETWIFEDMLYAVETAAKEGFPIVAVQDEHSLKDEGRLRELAEKYITSYSELQDFFTWDKGTI